MTDREKLIGMLRSSTSYHTEKCDEWVLGGKHGERPLIAESMADYLLANGVTFAKDTDVPSKWISVEDRLPTKEDADKVGHVMAIIKGDDFAQIFSWNTVAINPRGFTHWMPLPEPPKED